MKTLSILFLFLSSVRLQAGEPVLNKIGMPLMLATNCEIRWLDSATLSSSSATVYRVKPTEFSPGVISNILALTGFTWKDRGKFPSRWWEANALYFADAKKDHYLAVIPSRGCVHYEDPGAMASHYEQPKDVPSEEKALQLDLNFPFKLNSVIISCIY